MWTPTTRAQHRRDHLRYGRDLAGAERAVLEAIFCVLHGGIAWRMLPEGVPALPDRVRPVRGVAR